MNYVVSIKMFCRFYKFIVTLQKDLSRSLQMMFMN